MYAITLERTERRRLVTPQGVTISYERCGTGLPLVLVHGTFDNQRTNWQFVAPELARHFTLYAIARRGRDGTEATIGHSVQDEAGDVVALIDSIGEPVHLLGHSYGAQVALAAAARVANRVRKLVLYEPPWPDTVSPEGLRRLEELARACDWGSFATSFFHDALGVADEDLDALRGEGWSEIVADAQASLGDIRAMCRHPFDPANFRNLNVPVMLQAGTETPRELPRAYPLTTDALAAVLPNARIAPLPGQAHEAMKTAPDLYARQVIDFLRD